MSTQGIAFSFVPFDVFISMENGITTTNNRGWAKQFITGRVIKVREPDTKYIPYASSVSFHCDSQQCRIASTTQQANGTQAKVC
ncbi:MAG: hypothetical protein ACI9QV_000663 [Methylophagaceae bacterium]|jgi:hypothetical protein